MTVKNKQKPLPDNSTQRYLPFSQIRENIMIMKDGSSRLVARCSAINFLLKSQEEQDAIIISFQRFLNSLDFPIQILVRSKKLDIDGYLGKLKDKAVKQTNPLLQNQTYEYIEYLKKLIEVAQIMKKEFYIVIPFDTIENKSVKDTSLIGSFQNFFRSISGAQDLTNIKIQIKNFEKSKKWVSQRFNAVKTGLENIGVRVQPLDKQELVEHLTDYFNPRLDNFKSIKNDTDTYNLS